MAKPSKPIPSKSEAVKPAKNGKAKPVPVSTRSEAIKRALPALAAGAGLDVPATAETRLPPLDVGLSVRALGRELGMLSRTTALFARGGVFVTVDAATGDTKLMTAERFCSWIETLVWPCKDGRNGPEKTRLGVDLARLILASDDFAAHVRVVREVRLVRLPVFRVDGDKHTPELLPPGYDEATGVFTVDGVPYDVNMDAGEAQTWLLESVLPGYPWADANDGANMARSRCVAAHFAGMLTPYCSLMLPEEANRPMFVYLANQKGAGKSALAKMMLAPVYGFPAATNADTQEQELEKQISAALVASKPYLFLDNMKNFRSGTLAMVLTSPRVALRIMGKPDMPELVNNTLFVLTGITVNIGDELERRSVIVDLFSARDATQRRFEGREITDAWFSDKGNRARMLSALWAFVKHWRDNGMKRYPEAWRATFEACASLVGSIVMSLGMANPFAKREQGMGGDEEGEALQDLIRFAADDVDDGDSEAWTPARLVTLAEDHGLLDMIVPFAKDQKKALGHRFKQWRGRILTDHNGREFQFGEKHRTRGSKGGLYNVRILTPKAAL